MTKPAFELEAPKFLGAAKDLSVVPEDVFVIALVTDGTVTRCDIVAAGVSVGQGFARRRKQDKRNPQLGSALALHRAFVSASGFYAYHADQMLDPEPTVAQKFNKNAARQRKAKSRDARDEKRAAARMAYAEAKKSDPDTWIESFNAEADRDPDADE